jgi:phosphate starvation-inducible PhoH-like protein
LTRRRKQQRKNKPRKRKQDREARSVNKTPRRGVDPGYKPNQLTARTENQQAYIYSLRENDITFCTGPAGTGKTHIAVGMGVQMVREGFLERIIITRPLVGVGKDMGWLPGDMMDKVGPYLTPCFDELNYYLSLSMIGQWLHDKVIEVVPLSMMRGRTFNNAFIIIDEGQNASKEELKSLLTRIGEPSRLVLSGDATQSDLPEHQRGGFSEALRRLKHIDGINHVALTEADIVRHHLIGEINRNLW